MLDTFRDFDMFDIYCVEYVIFVGFVVAGLYLLWGLFVVGYSF